MGKEANPKHKSKHKEKAGRKKSKSANIYEIVVEEQTSHGCHGHERQQLKLKLKIVNTKAKAHKDGVLSAKADDSKQPNLALAAKRTGTRTRSGEGELHVSFFHDFIPFRKGRRSRSSANSSTPPQKGRGYRSGSVGDGSVTPTKGSWGLSSGVAGVCSRGREKNVASAKLSGGKKAGTTHCRREKEKLTERELQFFEYEEIEIEHYDEEQEFDQLMQMSGDGEGCLHHFSDMRQYEELVAEEATPASYPAKEGDDLLNLWPCEDDINLDGNGNLFDESEGILPTPYSAFWGGCKEGHGAAACHHSVAVQPPECMPNSSLIDFGVDDGGWLAGEGFDDVSYRIQEACVDDSAHTYVLPSVDESALPVHSAAYLIPDLDEKELQQLPLVDSPFAEIADVDGSCALHGFTEGEPRVAEYLSRGRKDDLCGKYGKHDLARIDDVISHHDLIGEEESMSVTEVGLDSYVGEEDLKKPITTSHGEIAREDEHGCTQDADDASDLNGRCSSTLRESDVEVGCCMENLEEEQERVVQGCEEQTVGEDKAVFDVVVGDGLQMKLQKEVEEEGDVLDATVAADLQMRSPKKADEPTTVCQEGGQFDKAAEDGDLRVHASSVVAAEKIDLSASVLQECEEPKLATSEMNMNVDEDLSPALHKRSPKGEVKLRIVLNQCSNRTGTPMTSSSELRVKVEAPLPETAKSKKLKVECDEQEVVVAKVGKVSAEAHTDVHKKTREEKSVRAGSNKRKAKDCVRTALQIPVPCKLETAVETRSKDMAVEMYAVKKDGKEIAAEMDAAVEKDGLTSTEGGRSVAQGRCVEGSLLRCNLSQSVEPGDEMCCQETPTNGRVCIEGESERSTQRPDCDSDSRAECDRESVGRTEGSRDGAVLRSPGENASPQGKGSPAAREVHEVSGVGPSVRTSEAHPVVRSEWDSDEETERDRYGDRGRNLDRDRDGDHDGDWDRDYDRDRERRGRSSRSRDRYARSYERSESGSQRSDRRHHYSDRRSRYRDDSNYRSDRSWERARDRCGRRRWREHGDEPCSVEYERSHIRSWEAKRPKKRGKGPSQDCTIFVGDLDPSTIDYELTLAFERFGEIARARVIEAQCYGFVTFESRQCAEAAVDQGKSEGGVFVGAQRVRVAWAHGSLPDWKVGIGGFAWTTPLPASPGKVDRRFSDGKEFPLESGGVRVVLPPPAKAGPKASLMAAAAAAAATAVAVLTSGTEPPLLEPKQPLPQGRQIVAYDDLF